MLMQLLALSIFLSLFILADSIQINTVFGVTHDYNIDFVLDKPSYVPRDTIHVTGTVETVGESQFVIDIINPHGIVIRTEIVDVEKFLEDGYFIPTFGEGWNLAGFYQLQITYGDEKQTRFFAFGNFNPSEFKPEIKLDRDVYSWTDKVGITVVSPVSNQNNNQLDEIKVEISSNAGDLSSYVLEETGFTHGVFSGILTLSGHSNYDVDGDGRKGDAIGDTGGKGPEEGRLSVHPNDLIRVSFSIPFSDDVVEKTAIIQSQKAQVNWKHEVIEIPSKESVRVIDPDMNLYSTKKDNVDILVWSSVQEYSKKYSLLETEIDSGIFEGTVLLALEDLEKGVIVKPGEKVFFKYEDRTLPSNFTTKRIEVKSNATIIDLVDPHEFQSGEKKLIDKQPIPNWIKNNAKWWSQDEISDSNFVLGIQFLINENIIKLPDFSPDYHDASDQHIPQWIKNNAKWWSENLITDDDFLKGIQYLVEHGIIIV